jgi:hypothetical protein
MDASPLTRQLAATLPMEHIVHASGRRKNVCATFVVVALGVPTTRFKYAETITDVVRILRRRAGYAIRSRLSKLGKNRDMVAARSWIRSHANPGDRFIVRVPEHVLLLDWRGNIIVDTAPIPEYHDARAVTHFYLVTR